MEIQVGGMAFEDVRHNAFWHNVHINTSLRCIDEDACEDSMKHIDDCINNPTIGLAARRMTLDNELNWRYSHNKKYLFSIPKVKEKNDIFESKFQTLYPRTGKLRKALIDNKRVNLNYVTEKLSSFKKVLFKLSHIV